MTRPIPMPLTAIAEALAPVNETQPALILEITAAIQAPSHGRKKIASVEAAARKVATAALPADPDATDTLFTIAELLAPARD